MLRWEALPPRLAIALVLVVLLLVLVLVLPLLLVRALQLPSGLPELPSSCLWLPACMWWRWLLRPLVLVLQGWRVALLLLLLLTMPCNKSWCAPCATALMPHQLLLLLLLLQVCRRRGPHMLRRCMVFLSVLLQRRLWLGGCG